MLIESFFIPRKSYLISLVRMIQTHKKSYNKFDLMILILIISQVNGLYFGIFNPIVFCVLLFSPNLLKNMQGDVKKIAKPFLLFFTFWALYNICSLLWAPMFGMALHYCFLFFINFILFLEIIVFSKRASSPHESIATGWLLAFMLTSFIGIWELQTGNHLSIAKEHLSRENANIDDAIGSYTSVTFYNINTYAIYILEVIPFVFYTIACKTSLTKKILAYYCGIMAMIFIFVDGSRGASLSLVLMFLVFLFLMWKADKKNAVWIVLTLGIIIYLLYAYVEMILAVISYRMETAGFEDDSRQVLYEKSLEIIYNSCGIGTGVGSMVPAMEAQGNQYGMYASHNLFLEFLMQFGFVLFVGFLYYLYKLFVIARKSQLTSKVVLYSALFGLPFYSIINSEYTYHHFVWCYFAVLFVYASPEYDNSQIHPTDKTANRLECEMI